MWIAKPFAAGALVCLVACGGGGGGSPVLPAGNPMPSISWVSPASLEAGGNNFTLIVSGANFLPASTVQWNRSNRTTTYVSPTQVTASIAAADVATAGTASVTVVNPAPGGGMTTDLRFTVDTGSGSGTSWPEPHHGPNGVLVDIATDLTTRAQLNAFLGGPLFAAWDPTDAGGPGMKIMLFGTPDGSCPAATTSGPLATFPDAVLTSDGYPGAASAVPADLRFTAVPAASCSSASAGKFGPANVFLDGSQLWFYTATLGNPTDLLKPYTPGGVRQGTSANLVNTSVNYNVWYQGETSPLLPWALNGRARVAALAQVSSIRAADATALTQATQGMAITVLNTPCLAVRVPESCQIIWQFGHAIARSNISDWTTETQFVNATVYADPVQANTPVVTAAVIPPAGQVLTDSQYGLPVLTSRGATTQHTGFASAQFDVEIDFYQLENAIRLASALTLNEPLGTDAACAQCIAVFGLAWNDPQSWVLSLIVSSQEIYDESGVSGEILGGYSWLYAGAAP